jgi:DNA-binding transcriptional regulator YiaG
MSMEKTRSEISERNPEVDDRGTGQPEAAQLLEALRERAFDSSDQKFAVALGRTVEEIRAWRDGSAPIDDDVVMKARGIAIERGVEIE